MHDLDPAATPAPADLGHLVAVIPVRGLERAKTRLGEALDPEERRVLVEGLLRRTIRAAIETPGVRAVAVVSPEPEALAVAGDAGAVTLPQGGGGLNEGLADGRAWAREMGATALLVVPADLPAIGSGELERVVAAARDGSPRPGDGLRGDHARGARPRSRRPGDEPAPARPAGSHPVPVRAGQPGRARRVGRRVPARPTWRSMARSAWTSTRPTTCSPRKPSGLGGSAIGLP